MRRSYSVCVCVCVLCLLAGLLLSSRCRATYGWTRFLKVPSSGGPLPQPSPYIWCVQCTHEHNCLIRSIVTHLVLWLLHTHTQTTYATGFPTPVSMSARLICSWEIHYTFSRCTFWSRLCESLKPLPYLSRHDLTIHTLLRIRYTSFCLSFALLWSSYLPPGFPTETEKNTEMHHLKIPDRNTQVRVIATPASSVILICFQARSILSLC